MSSLPVQNVLDFADAVEKALDCCDNFLVQGPPWKCRPFLIGGDVVGFVRNDSAHILAKHSHVFIVSQPTDNFPLGFVALQPELSTPEQRTVAVHNAFESIRDSGECYPLTTWRNESYVVSATFSSEPLLKVERSGAGLLGIKQYGAHLNAYAWVETETGREMRMWLARRSPTSNTFPGMLDQIAAGGIGNGMTARETIVHEAEEEAGIPLSLMQSARAVGSISYFFEEPVWGLFLETEFIFDIKLPATFQPRAVDGEVGEFYCWPLGEVCQRLIAGEFKPNCALVVIDFLVRHGIITADGFPDFESKVSRLHRDISPSAVYRKLLSMQQSQPSS